MFKQLLLSVSILAISSAVCMDKTDDNGNLTSFEVCGVTYDRNDDNSWSQTMPETVSHDDIMQSIDNTISSYESQTDTITTTTENK